MKLPQIFTGRVVHGFGRGHKLIGFATANLAPEAWIPDINESAYGVYSATVSIRGCEQKPAVLSIGKNPTFGADQPTFEVHILDFDEDIYGAKLSVRLNSFVRPMMQFNTVADLKRQIAADCETARAQFSA